MTQNRRSLGFDIPAIMTDLPVPRLLLDEPPLLVLPRLASFVGLNEAIMLQQVHYWSESRCCQGADPCRV